MKIDPEIIKELTSLYRTVKSDIDGRLDQFRSIHLREDDEEIFRELCFCILSSGVGPKMAERSVAALGDKLLSGSESELKDLLVGTHKYPDKASYIYSTREYLRDSLDLRLIAKLKSAEDPDQRRDFIADNKNIRGMGYVQASHFLRNVGFCGYAILDKNVLKSLYELGVTQDIKPPASRGRYMEKESRFREFASKVQISIDKLDLLLWYRRTNRVPR